MAELEKMIEHLKEIAEYFRECRSNASFASKAENHFWELQNAASEAAELLKAEEAKPLRCGGCSWFTQTQESGVGYCSFPNCEREVFDTEYCSWGAWTGKEG